MLVNKGSFTPNDSVIVTITWMDSTFDLFDGYSDEQNGLLTHFARQRNICYGDGDGVAWCERALRLLTILKQTLLASFLVHPAETSKNSDICDFLKVSDIPNEWWSMEK